jgi:DNA-binding MarR family transcriptional regulator
MTPLETYKFLKTKDVDLTAMMVLESLSHYDYPIMTGQIVNDATTVFTFASQATVFKYLTRLKGRDLIAEVNWERSDDGRCTYIEVTTKGKKLLKDWSAK